MMAVVFLFLLVGERAYACTVCFGGPNNGDVGRAFTWGIVILLVPTFAILCSLIYAVWRLEKIRRARSESP